MERAQAETSQLFSDENFQVKPAVVAAGASFVSKVKPNVLSPVYLPPGFFVHIMEDLWRYRV